VHTEKQEEPLALQFPNGGQASEQLVLGLAFTAQLHLHESLPSSAPSTSGPCWSAGKDKAPVQTGSAPTG